MTALVVWKSVSFSEEAGPSHLILSSLSAGAVNEIKSSHKTLKWEQEQEEDKMQGSWFQSGISNHHVSWKKI